MKISTKRSVLRVIHLIVTIPILGFIYGKPSEVEQYAPGVRFIFVPLIILTGYWMYSGLLFAVIGVGLWLSAICLWGYGAALLSQIVFFILCKMWLTVHARRPKLSV